MLSSFSLAAGQSGGLGENWFNFRQCHTLQIIMASECRAKYSSLPRIAAELVEILSDKSSLYMGIDSPEHR